jgi:hypothetical protein
LLDLRLQFTWTNKAEATHCTDDISHRNVESACQLIIVPPLFDPLDERIGPVQQFPKTLRNRKSEAKFTVVHFFEKKWSDPRGQTHVMPKPFDAAGRAPEALGDVIHGQGWVSPQTGEDILLDLQPRPAPRGTGFQRIGDLVDAIIARHADRTWPNDNP